MRPIAILLLCLILPSTAIFSRSALAGNATLVTSFPAPYASYNKLSIGSTYSTASASNNNLIVEGNVGIGTTNAPAQSLDINGAIALYGMQILTLTSPTSTLIIGEKQSSGSHNTFIGMNRGFWAPATRTGNNNTAIGYSVFETTQTASGNTGAGDDALRNISSGGDNVAVGSGAMQSNTSGANNTAVGAVAMNASSIANPICNFNTIIGYRSLRLSKTANYNSSLGSLSLYSNQAGSNNIALGYSALYNTTASDNIALGYNAGSAISSGTKNIVIGKDAAAPSATGTEQLVIGSTLYGTNIYNGAGAGTGNIGISVQAPAAKLDVAGDIKTSGNLTAATGNVTSVDLTATGNVTLGAVDYSKTATVRGTLSVTSGNGTALLTPASQTVASVVGNYLTITMPVSITTANIVGANNISMVLSGDLLANGYYHSSDERLKTNIQPITNALAKIRAINGVTYAYKAHPDQPRMGLIAQNVEKVAPELVATDAKGMKSVEYGNLVGLIVEGIKEQQQELDAIDRRIAKLEMK